MTGPENLENAVAVVGFAGRFPGAADPGELWAMLRDGRSGLTRFTSEQLAAAGLSPEEIADPSYVPVRGAVADVEMFDAGLFGMTPREADLTDPAQRLLLESCRTALEHAGYAPRAVGGRVGVFAGCSGGRYLTDHLAGLAGEVGETALAVGNDPTFLATRIAYLLDLRGPALTVATACSTSLVAVHLACQSVLTGESGLALAGGAAVHLPRVSGYLHTPDGVLSASGSLRSFDDAADGTVPGDGAAVVVLKHAEAALADGDTVHALIRGSAVNNDGAAKLGFTAPGVGGQAEVIRQAQEFAGVEPHEVSYVQAHATATRLGDPVEFAALAEAFGRGGALPPGSCVLGAVKPAIGHLDAAAGIAGLVTAVLALRHGLIPPTLGFTAPNREIDLAGSPFVVSADAVPWPRRAGRPRVCGVSSFGFGGTNAHVVLSEAPALPDRAGPAGRPVVVPLSARDPAALDALVDPVAERVRDADDLADVSFTLRTGRAVLEHRAAVVLDGRDGGAGAAAGLLASSRAAAADPGVVLLFPGQGSVRPGALGELRDRHPVVAETVDRCAGALPGVDLRGHLYDGRDDPAARQPALVTAQLALTALVRSFGLRPAAVLGHSLGQYTAAAVAGAWTPEELLPLVARRARALAELPPGAMLVVAAGAAAVEPRLPDGVWLSAVHGPDTVAVAGEPDAVAALRAALRDDGVAAVPVAVEHAHHTPAVTPVLDALRAAVAVPHAPLRLPLIDDTTGTVLAPGTVLDPERWVGHALHPARLDVAAVAALAVPDPVFLEIGTGSGLLDVVRRQAGGRRGAAFSFGRDPVVRERAVLEALAGCWTAGAPVDLAALPAGVASPRRIPLPTYPYQRRRHWVEERPRVPAAPVPSPAPVTPAAPATPVETAEPLDETVEHVRRIFGELLGHTDLDAGSDFLELGGTSITAIQMLTRLRRELGVRVPLPALFDSPTVGGVADLVRERLAGSSR